MLNIEEVLRTSQDNHELQAGDTVSIAGTQSLTRAIRLLRLVAGRAGIGWRLSDLAQACGQDKGTVHRMLACLVSERLIEQRAEDKLYVAGPMLYELGFACPHRHQFHRLAEAEIYRFARTTPGTVMLLLRSDTDFVCSVHVHIKGNGATTLLYQGARRPMLSSAAGVAILQTLPLAEQHRILRDNLHREMERHGRSRFGALQRLLDMSRSLGFGVNFGFLVPGSYAFALPLFDERGDAFASLCLIGAAEDYPESRIEDVHDMLKPVTAKLQAYALVG